MRLLSGCEASLPTTVTSCHLPCSGNGRISAPEALLTCWPCHCESSCLANFPTVRQVSRLSLPSLPMDLATPVCHAGLTTKVKRRKLYPPPFPSVVNCCHILR
ncbi:hypothetical protein AVEN_231017-1 [Araneus ventricosus]|uniref:Uncharacterized protein n=1 Tax=Araneus ventricosus TaxID=182803 RepID=A0A4Y2A2W0_ARAVE|nr:hypothetical protein AVEN_231017-1 [Araneus ventricosus]